LFAGPEPAFPYPLSLRRQLLLAGVEEAIQFCGVEAVGRADDDDLAPWGPLLPWSACFHEPTNETRISSEPSSSVPGKSKLVSLR